MLAGSIPLNPPAQSIEHKVPQAHSFCTSKVEALLPLSDKKAKDDSLIFYLLVKISI